MCFKFNLFTRTNLSMYTDGDNVPLKKKIKNKLSELFIDLSSMVIKARLSSTPKKKPPPPTPMPINKFPLFKTKQRKKKNFFSQISDKLFSSRHDTLPDDTSVYRSLAHRYINMKKKKNNNNSTSPLISENSSKISSRVLRLFWYAA